MGIILWVIFGAIAGYIATHIMGADEGLMWNIIWGIVGALVGGFIMNGLGYSGITGFNFYSFIVAVFGAVVIIYIGKILRRKN